MTERRSAPIQRLIDGDSVQLPAVIPDASAAKRRGQDMRHVRRGTSRRIKHGIYAQSEPSVRLEVIDEAALMFARAGWLDQVRDGPLVEATARIIVRLRKLDAVIDAGEAGQTLTSLLARLEGQLLRNLDSLGLTPTAAARLGLAHMSAADRARKAAEARLDQYAPKRRRK